MKRNDHHKPTIEDLIETSGIEILHPGGMELTRRTGEVVKLAPGMSVLDVSCGRGTLSISYAKEFGVKVTGLDISEQMLTTARANVKEADVEGQVSFKLGDSQELPFEENSFDVVINECAVGIPEDSQKVLDEMIRVVKPGGMVAIHESTWIGQMADDQKEELADRYGTTPLEKDEWLGMLDKAGASGVEYELEKWSSPDMFWDIRQERKVDDPADIMTPMEKLRTIWRVVGSYGIRAVAKAFENERYFNKVVLDGKLGYGLYWGFKA